jgi:hypothetical protein
VPRNLHAQRLITCAVPPQAEQAALDAENERREEERRLREEAERYVGCFVCAIESPWLVNGGHGASLWVYVGCAGGKAEMISPLLLPMLLLLALALACDPPPGQPTELRPLRRPPAPSRSRSRSRSRSPSPSPSRKKRRSWYVGWFAV